SVWPSSSVVFAASCCNATRNLTASVLIIFPPADLGRERRVISRRASVGRTLARPLDQRAASAQDADSANVGLSGKRFRDMADVWRKFLPIVPPRRWRRPLTPARDARTGPAAPRQPLVPHAGDPQHRALDANRRA